MGGVGERERSEKSIGHLQNKQKAKLNPPEATECQDSKGVELFALLLADVLHD